MVSLYPALLEHMGSARSWELSDLELGRIRTTVGLIPSDARTVLDVGCGDGRVLRFVPSGSMKIGADYAYSSVRRFGGSGVRASSATLPFDDRSFDLAMCCQVLEHLPDEVYRPTLRELERVARRHIVVSVPYRENLRLMHTRCGECRTVFHVWGHVRRFANRQLDSLFARFRPVATRYFGPSAPYHSRFVLRVNQRLGGRWAEFQPTTMCPTCGNTAFRRTPRNPVTIACGLVNLATATLVPVPARFWVVKLYSRVGSSDS
jgi:SAM-dependent methyltransferase